MKLRSDVLSALTVSVGIGFAVQADLGNEPAAREDVISTHAEVSFAGEVLRLSMHGVLRADSHWNFSKGLLETGEQAIAAARREVEKETGITQLDFRWGYDCFETGPYRHGKIARYYLAATSQSKVELRISEKLGRPEHDEYRWVSFEEGHELPGVRLRPVLECPHHKTGCLMMD